MASKNSSKTKKSQEDQLKLKKIDDELEEGYEYVTVPPDGGFGWVVALAAMVRWMLVQKGLSSFDHACVLRRCAIWFVMVHYLHLER